MTAMDDRTRLLLAGAENPFGISADGSDMEVMRALVDEGLFDGDEGLGYWITTEGDAEAYRLRGSS